MFKDRASHTFKGDSWTNLQSQNEYKGEWLNSFTLEELCEVCDEDQLLGFLRDF